MGNLRLLNKNEIEKAKNADKSKEIAEGLKISRRVDSLREMQAQEETALNKFRDESLAAIMKEIEKLNTEKLAIEEELKPLRKEREAGTKDIQRERNELNFLNGILQRRQETIAQKEQEANLKNAEADRNLRVSKDEMLRAGNHRELAEKAHREAFLAKDEAQKALVSAQTIENEAIRKKVEIESNLNARESLLNGRELAIKSREEFTKNKEEELRIKEIQLIDREQTLIRNIKRLNGLSN